MRYNSLGDVTVETEARTLVTLMRCTRALGEKVEIRYNDAPFFNK